MSQNFLFVYGTLRAGGVNAIGRLYPKTRFVGKLHVQGRLFDMGGYPAMLPGGTGASVTGEVYEIDVETLQKLDEFELGAGYRRFRMNIPVDGSVRSCWTYGPPAEQCADKLEIGSGDWILYSSRTSE